MMPNFSAGGVLKLNASYTKTVNGRFETVNHVM